MTTSCFRRIGLAAIAVGLLAARASAQPTNDLCGGALPLPIGGSVTGTTIGATAETGTVTCGPATTAPTVWYTLVGNGNTLTLDTCTGTAYDSELHVYCTTSADPCAALGALVCVVGNDDSCSLQSRVSFCSAAGQMYLVRVSGFGSNTGAFTVTATDGAPCTGSVGCAPPSTGACCANTTSVCTVTTSAACGSGNTYQGANTVCTPSPCPPTGSCCAVGGCCTVGPQAICTGTWMLAGVCTPNPCPAPVNDACSGALPLTQGVVATGSNCAATDDFPFACATTSPSNTRKTVWYTFAPAATATYALDTCGSSFDTVLGLFVGTCDALVPVACNDQSSSAGNTACPTNALNSRIPAIDLNAGTVYLVGVAAWGVSPTGGSYNLLVNRVVPGACCTTATAVCAITSSAACAAPNVYRGDNTVCTPTQCGVSGACCAASGVCTQVNASGCPTSSTYSGDGTVCSPNPCPQPGACCPPSGCCVISTQASCTSGTWVSNGACLPNPCPAPANDACAGALPLTLGAAAVGFNCAATDDRPISCATTNPSNTHKTVWFSFVPAATAAYTLDACGSAFDTILAVYSGSCVSLTEVACNDDSSAVGNTSCPNSGLNSRIASVNLVAGSAYLVELAGWGSFNPQGSYSVMVNTVAAVGSCCNGAVCTQTDAINCPGTFTVSRSCSPTPCTGDTGACCSGSTCRISAAAGCTGANTRFVGVGAACNTGNNRTTPCCLADYNQSGGGQPVTVQDVFDFLTGYFSLSEQADINGGGVTIQDVFDFLGAFFAGC